MDAIIVTARKNVSSVADENIKKDDQSIVIASAVIF